MDKKSLTIIMATISLSIGNTFAMEKESDVQRSQCAKVLNTKTLFDFIFSGGAQMPGTEQLFTLSSPSNTLVGILRGIAADKKMESKRIAVLVSEEIVGDQVFCQYAYTTDPNRTDNDRKFNVTGAVAQTKSEPVTPVEKESGPFLITQEQYDQRNPDAERDMDEDERPIYISEEEYNALMDQGAWEQALIDLGINPDHFNYNDQGNIQLAYQDCRKKAANDPEALEKCVDAKRRVDRGMFEWRNYVMKTSRLYIIRK